MVAGQRVLDVGCGPGALTAELVERVGARSVAAVDPSEPFVAAAAERNPGVRVERASAEDLPFADGEFDAALAQLVVHFMADPVAGLREMARVTRTDGVVAACVWDHAGEQGPLSLYWDAARELDADVADESQLAGARAGTSGRALRGGGPARGRGDVPRREHRAPDLRGVVGAVRARRRACRRPRRRPRSGRAEHGCGSDVARSCPIRRSWSRQLRGQHAAASSAALSARRAGAAPLQLQHPRG